MQRRKFLSTLAAAGLIASFLRADKPPSFTFGFSLYAMKGRKTEDALRDVAAIGFESVELCLLAGYDAAPANLDEARRRSIRQSLQDTKLRLTALMENLDMNAADPKPYGEKLDRAFALGNALSPDALPVVETVLGGGDWSKVKTRFRDRVGALAEVAAKAKGVLAIKPHRLQALNRPEDAVWLLDQVRSPALRLVFDWSHFQFRDLSLEGTVRQLIPHTAYLHVKDVTVRDGKTLFALPGEAANLDYVELLNTVVAAGYHGDISCEVSGHVQSRKDYDGLTAARQCYKNLAPAVEKVRRKQSR
jgi:inosose dehydratase